VTKCSAIHEFAVLVKVMTKLIVNFINKQGRFFNKFLK